AAAGARPQKEGQDAPWGADLVTEIEVIRLRVVEIDRALDEPEAEEPGVEVEVPLRITRDGGDVVQPENARHATLPRPAAGPARRLRLRRLRFHRAAGDSVSAWGLSGPGKWRKAPGRCAWGNPGS